MRIWRMTSLRQRVGWVLTALFAVMLVVIAAWWVPATRHAIHEEVEAASRVAEQWLNVLIPETLDHESYGSDRLMTHLGAVGRVRANQLEVLDAGGGSLYVSPESTWKAGRHAPQWFARMLNPEMKTRVFAAGDKQIVLRPDTSRAVLDAWDDFVAALAGVGAVLALVVILTLRALNRALAPLAQLNAALIRGAAGRFDMRLPEYRISELDRLSVSYNRIAESLDKTRMLNRQLEADQELAQAIQARLEDERRVIARELHDELGQAITAVRAIACTILQRCEQQPQLHGSAQAILAMTGQMQDGVHTILQRLRTPGDQACERLDEVVSNYCALWSSCHPDIALHCHASPADCVVDEAHALTVLRLLQESLTNVARHANASRVDVHLDIGTAGIELAVRDNGCGLPAAQSSSRFGIVGMHERVARLDGDLRFETPQNGGLRVCARLPNKPRLEEQHP